MQKRRSIYVESFAHRNPVPAACRIGNMVYSSGIHGLDPKTGLASAEGMDRQCELMFGHVRAIIEAAGGTTGDIIKMTLWMQNRSERHFVNPYWEAMFPDPAHRPTRHAMKGELESGMLIQCDFIAVVDGD
ncbi:Endoribonuclease L-PSP [Rhizobium sp. CF080]|uniref:RidA family protein n=1 Tax=Rhizobium sp. (strain CF080) TaxID=1144310 RepID=UPI000271D73D|nr:RidA family protein [Rhizobium sp. CF080]EUB99177.1 Endoribonuclease L-PSP [Rhizobium sp. CF080]